MRMNVKGVMRGLRSAFSRLRMAFQPSRDRALSSKYNIRSLDERSDQPKQIGRDLSFEQIEFALMDPQVQTAYEIIESTLLTRKLILKGLEDADPRFAGVAERLYRFLMRNERGIRKNLYTAILYGFSAFEVVYATDPSGEVYVSDLIPIHPSTVYDSESWDVDERTGELRGLRQVLDDGEEVYIPREKLLLFSYGGYFNDLRGRSILTGVYDNVLHKEKTMEWLLLFLKHHENPIVLGKTDLANLEAMQKALLELEGGRSKITITREDDVEVIEASKDGRAFFDFLKWNDMVIFRRFFIGTLIMGQGDGTGSYAQSRVQSEILSTILDGLHRDVAAAALDDLLHRLLMLNFPGEDLDAAPSFVFETFEVRDTISLLQALEGYFSNMIIPPEGDWFRKLLEFAIEDTTGEKVDLSDVFTGPGGLPPHQPGDVEEQVEDPLRFLQDLARSSAADDGGDDG